MKLALRGGDASTVSLKVGAPLSVIIAACDNAGMIKALISLLLIVALGAGAVPPNPPPTSPARALITLKALEGVWRMSDGTGPAFRIEFSSMAAGTVIQEIWFRGETRHSLTVYHRDGPTLIATHYCPQGNQPRLALASGSPGTMTFTFLDATNLDAAKQSYLVRLEFVLLDRHTLLRSEVYREEGKDVRSELRLRRGDPVEA